MSCSECNCLVIVLRGFLHAVVGLTMLAGQDWLPEFVPTLTAPGHGVLVSYAGTGTVVYIPLPMND
jgi:hypothetical protein